MTVKATTVRSLSTSSTGATVIEVPMVAAASSRVSHSDSEGDDLSEGDVTGSLGKFRKLKHLLHHFGGRPISTIEYEKYYIRIAGHFFLMEGFSSIESSS